MFTLLFASTLAAAASQSPQVLWNHQLFGGASRPVAVVEDPLNGAPYILGSTGGSRNFSGDSWHIYRYDASLGGFRVLRSSGIYDPGLPELAAADLDADGATELLILEQDGRLLVEDFFTGAFRFDRNLGIGSDSLTVTDLDGDQMLELVVGSGNLLYVFDRSGNLQWSVATSGSALTTRVGQCDADPALEIVTQYAVVDAGTRSIQWATSLAPDLHLFNADADPALEIVAERSSNLHVWDVETQSTLLSLFGTDTDELRVLDFDGDGNTELIGVEVFPGALVEHDPATLAITWTHPLPDAGYGNYPVIAGDFDDDGDQELHFYYGIVYDAVGGAELWREQRMVGPYVGAEVGDVDGDGRLELVTACSETFYENGCILVFDEASLELEAVSDPVFQPGGGQIYDVKLRDVDLDGRPEILVATAENSNPAIGVFAYANGAFTRTWTQASQPQGDGFARVEAADVDNDGVVEIMATTAEGHMSPTYGNRLYVYDGNTGALEWETLQLHPTKMTSNGLEIGDFDRDGTLEVAVMVAEGDVHVFSGRNWVEEALIPGEFTALSQYRSGSTRLLLTGSDLGDFEVWKAGSPQYVSLFSKSITTSNLYFVRVVDVAMFKTLWTVHQQVFDVRFPSSGSALWTASGLGKADGRSMTVKSVQPLRFYLTSPSGIHLLGL